MPTPITQTTVTMPPLEMWVEGRTARSYESQDFELVEYEAPPQNLTGVWSGKAKIRKKGGPTKHTFSPELVALHEAVCNIVGNSAPFSSNRAHADWSRLHSLFYGTINEGFDYHGTLMVPQKGECLEDIRNRITEAMMRLSEQAEIKPFCKP